MRIPTLICVLLSLFAFAISANAQSQAVVDLEPEAMSYRIKPVPQPDRTNLEIVVSLAAKPDQTFKIKLPTDNFGTPDIHKYVTTIEGAAGTVVTAGESDLERIVTPAANGSATIKYVLSYDPKVMEDYAFGPNTGADFFHLAGCQWMLHIGSDERQRRMQIEFVDVPKSWRLYTSMADNAAKFETRSSYDDWISAPIGGGRNSHQFDANGGRVAVYVHGKYAISRERIYSMIEKIIRTQRAWFNDYSQKDFTVVVAPRPWVVSGYAPGNSFVCFVKPDITETQLNRIVAHELFHNWLPNKISITQEKGFAGFRSEWFSEGFTDYFARKILSESGLMTREEFVQSINADVKSIVDNPHGLDTYEQLKALADARKFSAAAKKLAYFRGALIALNWDTAIRKRGDGKDLSAFIRELYSLAGKNGGKVTESIFYEFASKYGIDARGDVERFIMRGEAIVPAADAFGPGYDLRETKQPVFDIGFSLDDAYKTQKISGVAEGSAAYRAGLRNGMDFVSTENSARFSNAWSAESPLVVNVKAGHKIQRIQYFPNGEPTGVLIFAKKGSK